MDVAFVAGIDMTLQRFPDDELHVRVDGFKRRIAKARNEIKNWYDRERMPAMAMLAMLEARWPDQDIVVARRWTPRIKAPDRVQARVWELQTGKLLSTFQVPTLYTFDPRQRKRSMGGIRSLAVFAA